MNYYTNHDLARSRMQDLSREAERQSRVNEAYRASKLASARSVQPSSWSVVKRFPAMVAAAFGVGV